MADPSTPVTLGVWTDYSRDGVLAKTLTLRDRDAVVLLAFLATLVGIVGVRSWRISRFILFMTFILKPDGQGNRPRTSPQQVVLRNSETATGASFGLLSLVFPKSKLASTKSQRFRVALMGGMALGHGITFIALSILTSQLVLGKVVVSKATPDCGQWMIKQDDPDRHLVLNELILNETLDADNYVQNCYFGSTKSGIFDCERLMSQSIPFSVEHNASCPFSSEVCRTDGFAMDTGNVSISQLGINTKLADQLYFRRRSVCAPIREDLLLVDTYTSGNLSWLSGNDTMSIYRFYDGPENDTHEYATHWDIQSPAYELTSLYYPFNNSQRQYLAPPLRFSDELSEGRHGPSLVLLSGRGVTFNKEYDDPLWSVHTKVRYRNGTFRGINLDEAPTRYFMDRELNMIGCDERLQICAKHTDRCLPWTGLSSTLDERPLDDEAYRSEKRAQEIMLPLMILTLVALKTSIPDSIAGREGSALRASRYMHAGRHFYLEPEQWKTEVSYWFAMALARLQLGVYNTIERPAGLDPDRTQNAWDDTVFMDLCGRVKYRSANHTSMSFVGVIIVVVVSTVLIILSFFEVLLDLLPKRWRGDRVLQWESSENLALLEQRERLEDRPIADSGGQEEQSDGKNSTVHQVSTQG